MADIFSSLAAGGVKGIGDAVTEVIQQFHASPEQKAQIQAVIDSNAEKIAELNQQLQIKQIDAATQQDTTAGDTIRTELMSPDPWVRRAPVIIIWSAFFICVYNYIFIQTLAIWYDKAHPFNPPAWFWELTMFAIMGFVGGTAFQRAIGGQGGVLSLLGGAVKMDSKGD